MWEDQRKCQTFLKQNIPRATTTKAKTWTSRTQTSQKETAPCPVSPCQAADRGKNHEVKHDQEILRRILKGVDLCIDLWTRTIALEMALQLHALCQNPEDRRDHESMKRSRIEKLGSLQTLRMMRMEMAVGSGRNREAASGMRSTRMSCGLFDGVMVRKHRIQSTM